MTAAVVVLALAGCYLAVRVAMLQAAVNRLDWLYRIEARSLDLTAKQVEVLGEHQSQIRQRLNAPFRHVNSN